MAVKTFKVQHAPTELEIIVQIDFNHTTVYGDQILTMDEKIKHMVEFWMNYHERLADNAGDYIATFLKRLCEDIMVISYYDGQSLTGVIERFSCREGFCSLDGKSGIRLKGISKWDLSDQQDYVIAEGKNIFDPLDIENFKN